MLSKVQRSGGVLAGQDTLAFAQHSVVVQPIEIQNDRERVEKMNKIQTESDSTQILRRFLNLATMHPSLTVSDTR